MEPGTSSTATATTSSEIRFRNLITVFERWQDTHPEFAGHGALKKFAEAVGISERQMSHLKGRRRAIGNQTARKLEEALRLPLGFMDVPHGHGRTEATFPGATAATATAASREAGGLLQESNALGQNSAVPALPADLSEADAAAMIVAALRINREVALRELAKLYGDAIRSIQIER